MTIAFTCPECEKTFKVSDEMAGRKGKCNNCGATMLIPNSASAPAKAGSSRRFSASVDDDDDDRPRRRRRLDEDDFDDDEPRGRREERNGEDDGDDEDDRPLRRRRKKKKAKSNMALILSLSIGGTLAILFFTYGAVAYTMGLWPFNPGPAEAMKFMPDNAKLIMSVNWPEIEKSQLFQDLKKDNPNMMNGVGGGKGPGSKDFDFLVKHGLEDVIFATDQIPSGMGTPNFIATLRFRDGVTISELKEVGIIKSSATESKVGGYTVFDETTEASCLVNSKLVIGGTKDLVHKVLERNKKPELSDSMKAAMGKADFSKALTVIVDAKAIPKPPAIGPAPGAPGQPKGGPAGQGGANPMENMQKMLDEAEGLVLQASVASDLTLDTTVICKTAQGAEEMKKSVDGLIALAKFAPGIPKEATDVLGSLKISNSGTQVTASLTVKGDTIKIFAKNPLALAGFGGMGGAPNMGGFNPPPGNLPGNNPGGIRPPIGNNPGGIRPPIGNNPPGGGRPRPPGGKGGPPG